MKKILIIFLFLSLIGCQNSINITCENHDIQYIELENQNEISFLKLMNTYLTVSKGD